MTTPPVPTCNADGTPCDCSQTTPKYPEVKITLSANAVVSIFNVRSALREAGISAEKVGEFDYEVKSAEDSACVLRQWVTVI